MRRASGAGEGLGEGGGGKRGSGAATVGSSRPRERRRGQRRGGAGGGRGRFDRLRGARRGRWARARAQDLVLQEDDWVVVPDGSLDEASCVLGRVRRQHLEAGAVGVPRREALRVLRCNPRRSAVRPAEHDRHLDLRARHVVHLRRRVDHVVDRLHREVPRHELDDRPQLLVRGTRGQPGEARLGDRRVDHALGAVLLEQPLGDLRGRTGVSERRPRESAHAMVARSCGGGGGGVGVGVKFSGRTH